MDVTAATPATNDINTTYNLFNKIIKSGIFYAIQLRSFDICVRSDHNCGTKRPQGGSYQGAS